MSHKTANANSATNSRIKQDQLKKSRIQNALQARHTTTDSLHKARNAKKRKTASIGQSKVNRQAGRLSQKSKTKRRETHQMKSIVNANNDFNKLIEGLNQKIQEYSTKQQIEQSIMYVYICFK